MRNEVYRIAFVRAFAVEPEIAVDALEAIMREIPKVECDCAKLQEHLFTVADRKLSVATALHLWQHVEHCSFCEQAIVDELRLRSLLRRRFVQEAPVSLRMRIMQSVEHVAKQ